MKRILISRKKTILIAGIAGGSLYSHGGQCAQPQEIRFHLSNTK